MAITLTSELAQALDKHGNVPLPTLHPATGKTYFLVSEEQDQRLKPLFEEQPLSLQEQQFEIEQMGKRAGWDDPAMDAYNCPNA